MTTLASAGDGWTSGDRWDVINRNILDCDRRTDHRDKRIRWEWSGRRPPEIAVSAVGGGYLFIGPAAVENHFAAGNRQFDLAAIETIRDYHRTADFRAVSDNYLGGDIEIDENAVAAQDAALRDHGKDRHIDICQVVYLNF